MVEFEVSDGKVSLKFPVLRADLGWARLSDVPSWLGLFLVNSSITKVEVLRETGGVGTAYKVHQNEYEVSAVDKERMVLTLEAEMEVLPYAWATCFPQTVIYNITAKIEGDFVVIQRDHWDAPHLAGWPHAPTYQPILKTLCCCVPPPFTPFAWVFGICEYGNQYTTSNEIRQKYKTSVAKLERYFAAPEGNVTGDVDLPEAEVITKVG